MLPLADSRDGHRGSGARSPARGGLQLAIFRVLVHDCSYNNHCKHSFSEHRLRLRIKICVSAYH
jgi:hypothetical protein